MTEKVSPIRDALEDAVANVGGEPPGAEPQDNGLPAGCPVRPLGMDAGLYFYIDASHQFRMLLAREHSRLNMLSLFGKELEFLHDRFFAVNKDGKNTRKIDTGQLEEALLHACAVAGIWDPITKLRGAGGWPGGDGGLILHCGDQIFVGSPPGGPAKDKGEWHPPGDIGGYVYPASPPTPRPAPKLPARSKGPEPGEYLLELFKSWNWRRPDIDPWLLLGWVGAGILGGALKWRPMTWLTGDKATGKTTLLDLIHQVVVHILSVTDTTAPGVWQNLMHSTMPVAVDEAEATPDDRKMQALIKLARMASSGGMMLRGGDSGKGMNFQARSCFLFASILVPSLMGQDRSRMAILELDDLPEGAKEPVLVPDVLAGIGAGLRRRLVEQWGRYHQTLELYRDVLKANGHGGRGADQFGTLLAVADMLLADAAPAPSDLGEWGDKMNAERLAERDGDEADHEMCLHHIMTSVVDPWRSGERKTVAGWLEAAVADGGKVDEAVRALAGAGMRPLLDKTGWTLLVATKGQGLEALFRDTQWAGRVWTQALRRIDGAAPDNQRIGGLGGRCTRIPLTKYIKDAAAIAGAPADLL